MQQDDPFYIKVIAPQNDDVMSRKMANNAKISQNLEVINVLKTEERLSRRVMKLSKTTLILIVTLIILIIGFGAFFAEQSIANNKQNTQLDKSLNQIQKQSGE